MRCIQIDLSSDNHLQQPQTFGGYAGEHNETVLQVILPKRMIGIECSGYRFDFQTSDDNKIYSPLILPSQLDGDVVSFQLTKQLTIAGKLLFNVTAILSDGDTVSLISKTNRVVLNIGDTAGGNFTVFNPSSGEQDVSGLDGFSPIVEVKENESGHTVSITDANGTKSFDVLNGKDGTQGIQGERGEQGARGEKGANGSDGANGKDGISATHSWNGTVLTITSASGTSSADLKGEKGDKGDQGEQGIQGEKGDQGEQGVQGEKGDSGDAGKDGVSCTHSWNDTVLTVISASGTSSADLKGDKGEQGTQGVQGESGYTPIKGVDYWTEEEIEEINNNSEAYIIDELAKRGQVKPEFANDVSECTDTTKLYVLPNGYIYAYMKHKISHYTNQIPLSINSDGTQFTGDNGEIGYKSGYRFGSNGTIYELAGSACTGFIPIKKGNKVYFKNFNYIPLVSDNSWISIYDKSFEFITTIRSDGFNFTNTYDYLINMINKEGETEYDLPTTDEETGYLTSMYIQDTYNNVGYLRVSAIGLDESTVITVNEEIVDTFDYGWANTGHAFVPTDYEDRIIAVEESTKNHENRLKNLELYGADSTSAEDIPAYIKAEADSVIERLINNQGNKTFNMIGISDFHYGGQGDNKDNLIRACKAISYIQGRIHIDAVATLGDIIPHGVSTESTLKSGNRWFKEINEILRITENEGVAIFRTPGNHDRMGANDENGNPTEFIPDNAIFSYITGYNGRSCILGDVPGGWAYKDFIGHKLRVIVLNTDECEGKSRFSEHGYHISNKQYKWLIDTLDLNDKQDATEWQILLLSHHRADDSQTGSDATSPWYNNGYILPNILNAYQTGGSYSGVVTEEGISVSCNFAGKNQAKLIGQIHGHHHDYKFRKLYIGSDGDRGKSTQTDIMAIGTPTTSFITNGNKDNDGNTYSSVKNEATETAFCIYSIDLDNHKIYAIHYGNGIDREIDY